MSDTGSTKRALVGKVVSSKMNKTVVVRIDRLVPHALYGKYIRRSSKVLAHDETGMCSEGDTVQVLSSRPISKRKAWLVDRIVSKAT